MNKVLFLPALVLLGLGACATAAQQASEPTAEQYICADPATRAEKGGQQQCETWYAALRGPNDACAKVETTVECVKLLRGLEMAGFYPKT